MQGFFFEATVEAMMEIYTYSYETAALSECILCDRLQIASNSTC